MRAKNPAIRKKSDILNMCDTNSSVPIPALGERSTIAQIPGGRPGRNENPAWNTTPSSRANALTASSACSRSVLVMEAPGDDADSDEVIPPRIHARPDRQRHDAAGNRRGDEAGDVGGPDGNGPLAVSAYGGQREQRPDEEVDGDVAGGDDSGVPAGGIRVQPDAEQHAVVEELVRQHRHPERHEPVGHR